MCSLGGSTQECVMQLNNVHNRSIRKDVTLKTGCGLMLEALISVAGDDHIFALSKQTSHTNCWTGWESTEVPFCVFS